jgi:Tol biopolymer transport system component
MRKIILLGVVCTISMLASAQLLEIVSTQQLKTPQNEEMKVAGFSPKGDYVLLTNDVNKGLMHYDLATDNVTTITEADGAGWAVKISTDGTNIVYRERYMTANKLMKHNILEYNLTAKKKAMVAKEQRNLNKLVVANNSVSINENLHMVLTKDGKSTILTPNGENEAYNWASLSPDGQKILYYVSGKGCYTCDLNGRDIHYIALDCRAPQWYDNNIIIGMHDEDNGKWITASAIVAYSLQGEKQILVNKETIAIYPYTADGKIAFSTAAGKVYVMNVK